MASWQDKLAAIRAWGGKYTTEHICADPIVWRVTIECTYYGKVITVVEHADTWQAARVDAVGMMVHALETARF